MLDCWIKPANNAVFYLSTLYEATNGRKTPAPEPFVGAFLIRRYAGEYGLLELPAFVCGRSSSRSRTRSAACSGSPEVRGRAGDGVAPAGEDVGEAVDQVGADRATPTALNDKRRRVYRLRFDDRLEFLQ